MVATVVLIAQPLQVVDAGSVGSAPAVVATIRRYEVAPPTADHVNVGNVVTPLPAGADGDGAGKFPRGVAVSTVLGKPVPTLLSALTK